MEGEDTNMNIALSRLRVRIMKITNLALARKGWGGIFPADILGQFERVASEWTFAEWIRKQTGLDMPGEIRARIARNVLKCHPRRSEYGTVLNTVRQSCTQIGIPPDCWDGYLACLYTEYERQLAERYDFPLTYLEFCSYWLRHELRIMTNLAPVYFGLPGNQRAIRQAVIQGFAQSPWPVGASTGFSKTSHGANAQLGEEGQGSSNEILQGLAKQGHLLKQPHTHFNDRDEIHFFLGIAPE